MNEENSIETDDSDILVSKSAIKREMARLRDLGTYLTTLTENQLSKLPLSEKLHLAIKESHKIKQNNARKRHFQYIGKLMRHENYEKLESAINEIKEASHRQTRQQPLVTSWAEKLIQEGQSALQEFIHTFPNCEIQQLRQLIKSAKAEQEKTPFESKTAIQYKKLLKLIQSNMADQ